MFRCEHDHPLSRLDVYICPIKIILSVETGCVMFVIAQWYNCCITSFLLKMRLKTLKNDWNQFQISVFEKGDPLRIILLQFIRTGKYHSRQSTRPEILEQRLLPKLTLTGSDLNNIHS